MEIVLRQATEDDVTELATLNKRLIYLRQFYIDRPMRRQGIGTAAYELLAKERFGNREVAVDVLATNPDSQKFWAHLGFTPYFTSMKKR